MPLHPGGVWLLIRQSVTTPALPLSTRSFRRPDSPARSAGGSTSGAVVPRKRSGAPCASCGNPVVDPKAAWPESWMGALAPHRRGAGWSAQAACAPYADWGHHSAPSKHAGMSPADASCHRASARGSAVTIFYNISVMLRCVSHTTGVSRPSFSATFSELALGSSRSCAFGEAAALAIGNRRRSFAHSLGLAPDALAFQLCQHPGQASQRTHG